MRLKRSDALDILEIEDEEASSAQIKTAYFNQARKWHPDKNPDNVHDAKVQFQKVTAAYERLTSEGDLPDEDSDDEDGYGWDFDEDAYYQAEDHFCNIWEEMRVQMNTQGGISIQLPRGFEGFAHEILRSHGFNMAGPYGVPHGLDDDDDDYSEEDDSDYTDSEDDSEDDNAGDGFYPRRGSHFPRPNLSIPAQDLLNDPLYGGNETSHTRRMSHEDRRKEKSEAFKASRAEARQKAKVKAAANQRVQPSEAQRKADEEKAKKAEAARIHAKNEALKDHMAAYQPPRPVIVSRTETQITLNLAKRNVGNADSTQYSWELECCPISGTKIPTVEEFNAAVVTIENLQPGMKYDFYSRRGLVIAGEKIMSLWSAVSSYPTAGEPPKTVNAAPEQAPARKQKKEKAKKAAQQQQPSLSPEEEAEILKEAQERDAAAKKAMEKAAEEYAAEAKKMAAIAAAAPKPAPAPKERTRPPRSRNKKKQNAEDDFWAPVKVEPKVVRPGDMPAMDAPTVKKINFSQASQFAPQSGNDWTPPDSNAMSEMERLQLEEAIQLSLALEASKQDDRHSAYRYYQGDDIDTDAFGGVAPKQEGTPAPAKKQHKVNGWGHWGEEVSPADSGHSAATQHKEESNYNQVTSTGVADDDDDGWGAPPKEQESSWGQHKQTQSPAPASDKQDSWKAPQQDEGWGPDSGWGGDSQQAQASSPALQPRKQGGEPQTWQPDRISPPKEKSPSEGRQWNQEPSLLPELANDPWDQYPKPPQAQPSQRPKEPPGTAHATYQPYNPIKKLPIQTPAPQAAKPYLPPATPAAKPPPASLRPTAAAFNPTAAAYKPPPAAYNPPTAAYNPPPATYNPPPAAYNPPPAAYNPPTAAYNPHAPAYQPPQNYRQRSFGPEEMPYARPPASSHWEPPQQQVSGHTFQNTGSYNRPDADLQRMMNDQSNTRPAPPFQQQGFEPHNPHGFHSSHSRATAAPNDSGWGQSPPASSVYNKPDVQTNGESHWKQPEPQQRPLNKGKWGDESESENGETGGWPSGPQRGAAAKNSNNGWADEKPGKADQAGDGWTGNGNGRQQLSEDGWAAGKAHQQAEDDSGWGGGKQESKAAPKSRHEPKKPDHKGSLWVPSSQVEDDDEGWGQVESNAAW